MLWNLIRDIKHTSRQKHKSHNGGFTLIITEFLPTSFFSLHWCKANKTIHSHNSTGDVALLVPSPRIKYNVKCTRMIQNIPPPPQREALTHQEGDPLFVQHISFTQHNNFYKVAGCLPFSRLHHSSPVRWYIHTNSDTSDVLFICMRGMPIFFQ